MDCDWGISIRFVCICVPLGSLLVIVQFEAIIDLFTSKIFSQWSFLFLRSLARIKQCLSPSIDPLTPSTNHGDFLRYSWAVYSHSQFCFCDQAGRLRCIVICITCNQPHIFADSALKSPTLRFTRWAPFAFAVKWAAVPFSWKVRIVQNFFTAGFDSGKPRRCQNIFSLIYTNFTIPYFLYPLEKLLATYFELALSTIMRNFIV